MLTMPNMSTIVNPYGKGEGHDAPMSKRQNAGSSWQHNSSQITPFLLKILVVDDHKGTIET